MGWAFGLGSSPWGDVRGHDTWWGAFKRLVIWTLFSREDCD
jgi:hypothetical protein